MDKHTCPRCGSDKLTRMCQTEDQVNVQNYLKCDVCWAAYPEGTIMGQSKGNLHSIDKYEITLRKQAINDPKEREIIQLTLDETLERLRETVKRIQAQLDRLEVKLDQIKNSSSTSPKKNFLFLPGRDINNKFFVGGCSQEIGLNGSSEPILSPTSKKI